jgi:tetratricopeptide (TPR) repeat protein
MARGVGGFGRLDLPVAREAGLPEVRAPGIGPADLPSVGDALPAVVGHSWDSANLPATGGEDPFADFGAPGGDDDPFAGSEADFGSPTAVDDPFGRSAEPEGFGAEAAEPGSSAGYGEVDIGGGLDAPAIETEDMEQSIPQRSSSPATRANAAAHASVHENGDTDTAGSTLELGPERRAVPRRRSRRLVAALAICAATIAGGALALEPRLGPFGIHFILDQVHRPEHERQLAQLVLEGRNGSAKDTLDAASAALGKLEAARSLAPRFEPLQARSAFAHYDVALRFGPLPKLEAAGKAALERIDPQSQTPAARLARAAHAAATRDKEASKALAALGNDPDARLLSGELALRDADWGEAAKIWSELAKGEPQSARAAFGLARAELGRGQAAAARSEAQRVLTLSPEHVGARILLLEAQRALVGAGVQNTPADLGTETLVSNVQQALPHASPGEAALAHSVLGEVHASQGRVAPAQHSFEEALAVNRSFTRALVGLGEALALAGRHVEALARFEAAVQGQPDLLQAELGVAKSQVQLARVPEAQAILKRLLEKHKNHLGVLYWRGRAEQAAGDNDAALATYRAAIDAGKGSADSVDAYLALARLQADQGQLALAEQTLSEAQQKLPPSGALHKALGEIAMSRGEYERAYGSFQQALTLDRGDTRARFLGATALTRLGRFEEALSAFASVSETDKDFPGLAVERGRLFEESGRNEQALQEYEAAFAKSPDDPEVQIRVGCSRAASGRTTAAREVLEKALKVRQRSAEANHCLGRALFDEEHALDGLLRLERAVALDPTRAVYHLYVGWVAAELGRLRDASISLEKALELDKGLADAYWQRGRLRQKQGAVRDAIRDLQHALELKPARNEARADLAAALADLGRTREALQAWEDAIARDADNPTWHFRYAKLLSSSGSGEMAQAHLRRAIDLLEEARKAAPAAKPKPPAWLWQAHYLLARELGQVPAAVQHWQAFLKLSPTDDPYRAEAQRALAALGQPWDPH